MKKTLISYISPINLFMTVMVVMVHAYNAAEYGIPYSGGDCLVLVMEDIVSQGIAHLAVPVFFFISGFHFFNNLEKKVIVKKIGRRMKTLLPPYFSWNILYYLFFVICTCIPAIANMLNSVSINISFIGLLEAAFLYKNNYIMWYIYQLILYVLLTPIIYKIVSSKISCIATTSLLFAAYSLNYLEIPNLSLITPFIGLYPDMLLYFILGCIAGRQLSSINININKKLWLFTLFGAVLIWLINRNGYKMWRYNSLNMIFILFGIATIFLFVCTRNQEFRWKNKILSWVANNTFFIFAFHPVLVEILQKITRFLFPQSSVVALIEYIIVPILAIAICLVASAFTKKFTPRLRWVLTGGR